MSRRHSSRDCERDGGDRENRTEADTEKHQTQENDLFLYVYAPLKYYML